jgi:hypothetical protein
MVGPERDKASVASGELLHRCVSGAPVRPDMQRIPPVLFVLRRSKGQTFAADAASAGLRAIQRRVSQARTGSS